MLSTFGVVFPAGHDLAGEARHGQHPGSPAAAVDHEHHEPHRDGGTVLGRCGWKPYYHPYRVFVSMDEPYLRPSRSTAMCIFCGSGSSFWSFTWLHRAEAHGHRGRRHHPLLSLEGSFSTVSKQLFATIYLFCIIFREVHSVQTSAPL